MPTSETVDKIAPPIDRIPTETLGLKRERAVGQGGLFIESVPYKGAQIEALIPLNPEIHIKILPIRAIAQQDHLLTIKQAKTLTIKEGPTLPGTDQLKRGKILGEHESCQGEEQVLVATVQGDGGVNRTAGQQDKVADSGAGEEHVTHPATVGVDGIPEPVANQSQETTLDDQQRTRLHKLLIPRNRHRTLHPEIAHQATHKKALTSQDRALPVQPNHRVTTITNHHHEQGPAGARGTGVLHEGTL